jgi:hypothetical protein
VKAVYQWWATLVFVVVIVQVGLAGYGAFYVVSKTDDGGVANEDTISHGFDAHVAFGYTVVGLSMLIFVVIGAIAGVGRWRLGKQAILFGLFVLQVVLAAGGESTPFVGFFHPVNALLIFSLSGWIAYTTWRAARVRVVTAQASAAPEAPVGAE